MGKAKGRFEQEHRLVSMTASVPDSDVRWYPNLDSVVEEYRINMPLLGLGRIVGRQALDSSNRLVEFSLTSQVVLFNGAWADVARIDTAHGEVHAHYFSRTGEQIGRDVLLPIRNINDVDRGYQLAEKLLIVMWDEHERRWRHGC